MKNPKFILFAEIIILFVLLSACARSGIVISYSGKTCDTDLIMAIADRNLEGVKAAVSDGADLNMICDQKIVPLYEAMDYNEDDIILYLLEQGADPNQVDKYGISLLMYAAGAERPMITNDNVIRTKYCMWLIEYGADVNLRGKQELRNGYTAIDCALRNHSLDSTINLLLENGATGGPKTARVIRELVENNECDYYSAIQKLVKASKLSQDDLKLSPALEAVISQDFQTANHLIEDKKWAKEDGINLLFFATASGRLDTVQLLEKQGISLSSKDSRLNTPLLVAAENGWIDEVNYFIKNGVDLESADWTDGETAFTKAIRYSHFEIAECLLEAGAKIQIYNEEEVQRSFDEEAEDSNDFVESLVDTMQIAVETKNTEAIQFLLDHGYPYDPDIWVLSTD